MSEGEGIFLENTNSDLETDQEEVPPITQPDTKPSETTASFTNIDDFFSLDMVSDDMDFEQAYSAYSLLQRKNALNAVEHLKKVQILNQQFDSTFAGGYNDNFNFDVPQHTVGIPHPQQQQQQHQQQLQQYLLQQQQQQQLLQQQQQEQQFLQQQTGVQPQSLNDYSFHRSQIISKAENTVDDFDHFFSNTESNALEQFLDKLANPTSTDTPQSQTEFYTHQPPMGQMHQPSLLGQSPVQNHLLEAERQQPQHQDQYLLQTFNANNSAYDLHTMMPLITPPPQKHASASTSQSNYIKHELTEAFSHPPSVSRLSKPLSPSNHEQQLPTPVASSRQSPPSSLNKRAYTDELDSSDSSIVDDGSQTKKRKRSSMKQLLTLEQKRLNHSYSEQKRRQLCKVAYERCLRLIINLDEYINLHKDGKKTIKRKQKLKDGLPNISKHTALVKISNEIITIQEKNNELQRLLMA